MLEKLGKLSEKILVHALETLKTEHGAHSENINLHLKNVVLAPGDKIHVAGKTIHLPTTSDALHIFADLAPLSNWAHPARHLFYHPHNGILMHSEYTQFPTHEFETDPNAFEAMHIPKVHSKFSGTQRPSGHDKRFYLTNSFSPKVLESTGNRYAILFSGCSNNRHLNDLEFLYRVLIDTYHFKKDNIIVLNFDGTLNYNGLPQPVETWPGNNTPYRLKGNINGPGNKQALESALSSVASKIASNDLLLIHTNNHGGPAEYIYGEPWLCGHPNYSLACKASELGRQLSSFPKFESLVVSMEQCFSGGFMSPIVNNSTANFTSFSSAVPANMSSMGGADFNPWAQDWIAAFNGAYPDGSALKRPEPDDPSTTIAFEYSNNVHVPGDCPVHAENPSGEGIRQHLDGSIIAQNIVKKSD